MRLNLSLETIIKPSRPCGEELPSGTGVDPSGRRQAHKAPAPHSPEASPQNPRGGGDRGPPQTDVARGLGKKPDVYSIEEKQLPLYHRQQDEDFPSGPAAKNAPARRGHRVSPLVPEDPQSREACAPHLPSLCSRARGHSYCSPHA